MSSANFFGLRNIPELSSCQSETGCGTYRYAAINCTHHFQPSICLVTKIYHLWSPLSTIITFNLSSWIVAVTAADFLTAELVCKILSNMRNRNKTVDWTAVCWNNKNVMTWDPHCTPPEVTPIARLGQLWKHQAVNHPSTNIYTLCLTSEVSRELVYLKYYALALIQIIKDTNLKKK